MLSSSQENHILFKIDFEEFIYNYLELREMVICTLLVEGFSQKDISKHQRISYTYVKNIVRKIRIKFLAFKESQKN